MQAREEKLATKRKQCKDLKARRDSDKNAGCTPAAPCLAGVLPLVSVARAFLSATGKKNEKADHAARDPKLGTEGQESSSPASATAFAVTIAARILGLHVVGQQQKATKHQQPCTQCGHPLHQ